MLIRPAIGDTDPIRYRRPNPDGQFSSNILDEAMRGQIWEPIDISHPEARFVVCIGLVGLLYSVVFGIKLASLSSPDAISLRLTSSGFEVAAGLQKRTFLWTQVSDFDVFAGRRSSEKVVFRYDGPHRSPFRVGMNWLDAAFAGGRNAYLPDTYGLRTADLVRVLTTWRELAVGPGVIIAHG